jgi:cephalosporin hydroxylase
MTPPDSTVGRLGRALADPAAAVAYARRRAWRLAPPLNFRHRDYWRRLRIRGDRWLLRHQEIVFTATWLGVRAFKNPLDAWIYQEIITETRPDTIIEIGGAEGGGALYLASLLDLLGGDGNVISVEIDRSHWKAPEHPRIVKVDGDSCAPETVEQVKVACGDRVMVIHDGDHSAAAVSRDLELYAPLVSPGCYLIVEDGVIDLYRPGNGFGPGEPGPLTATDAFRRRHPEFELDMSRERFVLTYNPRGYLRRRD